MAHSFYRFIRTLHAWGGVTLALLLILTCVTGTLLVWKQEYVKFTTPQARVDFVSTPAALARIAEAVDMHFDPDEVNAILFATPGFPLTKVLLTDTRYAYLDADGNVVDEWVQNERWEEWLYDLHHRLLLEDTGLTLVGLAALAMLLLVFAGVITFWPLWRGFRLGLWPRNWSRPQLRMAHRNLGIVLLLPLLLILLTGAMLAFPLKIDRWLLDPMRRSGDYGENFVEGVDTIVGAESSGWLAALERAQAVFPDAVIRSARVPNAGNFYRIIGLQQTGDWHPYGLSTVYVDAAEGYMDLRIDATALPLVERSVNVAYPLHTGTTGSLVYKWLLTLAGVLITVLSVLGLVSFLRKK